MKKISLNLLIFSLLSLGFLFYSHLAWAMTPVLTLANTEGDNVQINVTADPNSSVILGFQKSTGGNYLQALGTTNSSGIYSTIISTATYNIIPSSLVYVQVNNQQSTTVSWPYAVSSEAGAITLNKTGLVMTVGESVSLTVNNLGDNLLYLLSNSNPQIANINISGNQINVFANTYGQTVFTLCALGTTSNCASAYLTVQNSGAQALTFSQNNLTIAYNQSATVSILNGTNNNGAYSILNNSNPSVISASISGKIITLNANNNSGTASLTVCSTDMNSCGIISAAAGNVSSVGLTFSSSDPMLLIGQSKSINISGGTNYNISSNSNSNVVSANINNSNNSLSLTALSAGSSVITVCSATGNCNSLTATVGYSSSGGPISLNQNNLWLQVGQAVSVTISGGTMPYIISNNTNNNFQASLNNNILTLTGIAAGSSSMNVCSAGGACTSLSVLVNGISTSQQLTFSNNNLSLRAGGTTSVTLFGAGGYYISKTNNQNIASFSISDNKVNVSALSAGSANATVCQTGGQCGVIYVSVTSDAVAATPITFSQNSPTISVGQNISVVISGGSSNSYYISSNSNPTVVQANIKNNTLSISGQQVGSAIINVCTASNTCNSLAVSVVVVGTNNSTTNTSTTPANDILHIISIESNYLKADNVDVIAGNAHVSRNTTSETASFSKYILPLINDINFSNEDAKTLNYFVMYGTPSTLKLGAGERAGLLSSYWQTYGKLPKSLTEWSDALKIGSGRWPSELNIAAENQAKLEFKKVYNRDALASSSQDSNAITIIAYGLRPKVRNMNSEKAAIHTFNHVYGHYPANTLAWNIVRAIAYSGATR